MDLRLKAHVDYVPVVLVMRMDIALYVLLDAHYARMINAYFVRMGSTLLEKVLVRETVRQSKQDVLNAQSHHVLHVM